MNLSSIKKQWTVYNSLLLLVIILFLIGFIVVSSQIKTQWAQDSHWHMSLIKNLALGKGYTIDGVTPHGKYPPGLSFLILPLYLIINNIQTAGLILLGALSVLSIFLAYKIGKFSSTEIAILCAMLLAFNSLFIFYSVSIMTEIPFMFFSLACLFCFIKSFENKKWIILSLTCFAISSLIRYDGVLLVLPIIFYSFIKRKELGKIISKEMMIGFCIAGIIIGAWLTRNLFVFHSIFYTDYSSELAPFSFSETLNFFKSFFYQGIIFSIFSLIGIYYLIKSKNNKLNMYFLWFVVYIVLHIFWSSRAFRFYTEIVLITCIFCAFGISSLSNYFKSYKKIFIIIIIVFLILEQSYIFFNLNPDLEASYPVLNRYNSIKTISEYANTHLTNYSINLVPDIAVYSLYLNKPNTIDYNNGLNYILKNQGNYSVFMFLDTLHPWITQPFLSGENGSIILNMGNNNNLLITTELIKKETYANRSCSIIEIKQISINPSS